LPIRMVLTKVKGFENSEDELSDDALKALSEQENNFIKLYPNPFENDLIVSYSLEEKATVKVELLDLSGNSIVELEKEVLQEKGSYNYFVDGTHLEKGMYIITVVVNNQRETRIVVKK
uniref:T9SS type A sorting domain-containing protein n=1 Tax=uncultured Tenacibaculum sp. TaxID=174713 RepID=UPI00261D0249